MKILITGGTGFIGQRLVGRLFENGDEVFILTRQKKTQVGKIKFIQGDLNLGPLSNSSLEDIEVVIHLAGENVGKGRWTTSKKQAILDSRQMVTQNLIQSIKKPLRSFISASAVGYYGDTKDSWVNENSPNGEGFLSDVCVAWEKACDLVPAQNKVIFRIGVVLSSEGGAYPQMALPFRFGFGGPLGDGQQWVSWIHIQDLVELFVTAIHEKWNGVYNAMAPELVTNREMSQTLARLMGRRMFFSAPRGLLRLVLGEQANLILDSCRVSSKKVLSTGFKFQYSDIQSALQQCLTATRRG